MSGEEQLKGSTKALQIARFDFVLFTSRSAAKAFHCHSSPSHSAGHKAGLRTSQFGEETDGTKRLEITFQQDTSIAPRLEGKNERKEKGKDKGFVQNVPRGEPRTLPELQAGTTQGPA